LNSPPPLLSFPSPPFIPGIVSTGIIFYLHTFVHIFCTILTLLPPFPATSLLPQVPIPSPCWTCSSLLFSDMVEFKMTFFLFEIKGATQGVSLCQRSLYFKTVV
jgi:hypothetical protein